MTPRLADIWVYLSATPLLGLTMTLLVYQGAFWIYRRANFNPLLNPVPIAVAVIVAILILTGTPYQTYFDGAQFVHFLLGPATVALAIPLYPQLGKLRRFVVPVIGALLVGAAVSAGSAALIAWTLGASRTTILSLLPKSVTAPIAMGISEKIGGLPTLTAVMCMVTGVFGVLSVRYILNFLRVTDHGVRGFAVGVAAHGLGIARAFQVSEEAGAFAGVAMAMTAFVSSIIFPLLLWFFAG
ncbi:MAG TPA: LrgB family protein [Burkholderiales bacterium]|jgi:predicted murein hydrolase (TIGR00659 family)|nr:LrgB family protein [Burkholderiales bacterium]